MALADCGIPLRSRLAGLNQMMRGDTFICWWIQRSLTHALGKGLATWNIAELEHFHKKPYFNLPSDLPCIGFDSVKLIIIKKKSTTTFRRILESVDRIGVPYPKILAWEWAGHITQIFIWLCQHFWSKKEQRKAGCDGGESVILTSRGHIWTGNFFSSHFHALCAIKM